MLPAATMFAFGKRCAFGSDIAFAVILSSTVIFLVLREVKVKNITVYGVNDITKITRSLAFKTAGYYIFVLFVDYFPLTCFA